MDVKDVLNKVLKGVKLVAPSVANTFAPGSGSLIEGLMRIVTGDNSSEIEAVAAQIASNPTLMVELQTKAMEHEVKLAEVEARKLEAVNQTMQSESKSEHWPQYSWRPFNGFSFPVTVFCVYFIIPMFSKIVPEVPYWVWAGWLSILGVATWDRGKEKRAKAGEQKTGVLTNAINAIRGN